SVGVEGLPQLAMHDVAFRGSVLYLEGQGDHPGNARGRPAVTGSLTARRAKRRSETNEIAVRIGVRAFVLAVVEVHRLDHLDSRPTPTVRQRHGVADVQPEPSTPIPRPLATTQM